ncbi:DUF397 domain-containing protein [Frankia sp. AgB1.9]|uniref:DUF397 domain-containing protein n=1 Tax=unclassified Frankia TaxID=2632575 RepID=UPI0019335E99|nr:MULTISPECIES: DUF397 domain-containing protein [unclassified Frankia]MBL7487286.1 DUF397 domain-containing protein [Frankia sp. AgW1.1]MBL7546293.1 DUF397 domain-containing protein [Frankia sp. AgB1.9]MBL7618662.1 DUF397 domain-containing protein [Frankia sp. AgB1.8]
MEPHTYTPASAWQTSSLCVSDNCVEVAVRRGEVRVRDSKDPHGPVLRFTVEEWSTFLGGARLGEFEPPVC